MGKSGAANITKTAVNIWRIEVLSLKFSFDIKIPLG
ncbi:MAG: hypothetical protein ACJAUK_000763 [Colwellia polaris]|jgi:hypothetical protein